MYFDDIKLGTKIELEPVKIEKEKMMEFARQYDSIPLHLDEEYAKKTPFGGLIAPGVMSFMSVWNQFLKVDFYGDELIAGLSTSMEWHKPVYADDVLTGIVEVTSTVKRNAKNGLIELTIKVYNQDGVHVLTDVTKSVVKCRQ